MPSGPGQNYFTKMEQQTEFSKDGRGLNEVTWIRMWSHGLKVSGMIFSCVINLIVLLCLKYYNTKRLLKAELMCTCARCINTVYEAYEPHALMEGWHAALQTQ